MRGFTEVTTKFELQVFERAVGHFVDAVIKEAHLLHSTHVVPESRAMAFGHGIDVQLIVQTQTVEFDIEIVLCGLNTPLVLTDLVYDDGLDCSIGDTGRWPAREIRIGDLRAARLFYRTRPMSGPGAMLGPELPAPDAVPAASLQSGWRQCSECCDAWEELDAMVFSRCPSCGAMTELAEE